MDDDEAMRTITDPGKTPDQRNKALDGLMSRHGGDLLGYVRSLVRNEAAADDVAQETWLRVWKNASRFQPGTSLRAWLFTIAAHLSASHLRSPATILVYTTDDFSTMSDTRTTSDRWAIVEEMQLLVADCLSKLSTNIRQVITLRLGGADYGEIARVCDFPVSRAHAHWSEGCKRLRDCVRGKKI